MKTYAVYVSEDNGWLDGCPSTEDVFFGEHAGTFVHGADGAIGGIGHVVVTGYRAAVAELRRLRTTGDWIAPAEVNPDGEESSPSYAMQEIVN